MLKAQVDRTPPPQWVRVVAGFTEHQFAEKLLPAIDELNAVALIGLLGMLIGDQFVPPVKRLLAGEPLNLVWFHRECVPKITGLPAPVVQATKEAAESDSRKA